MNRSLRLVSAAVTLAVAASAQCFTTGGTSVTMAGNDDNLSAETPLGITFPMAGGLIGNYTHCVISTNGVLYLTDGTGAVGASATNYGSVTQLRGSAGDSPRIAPYWDDLWAAPTGWDITIESTASSCTVRWMNVLEWNNTTGAPKSFSVTLNDTGIIDIAYDNFDNAGTVLCGVSGGNGVADPGSIDLSGSPTGSTEIVYESFPLGTFDLLNSTLTFVPNGVGYDVVTSCVAQPAANTAIGTGCYAIADTFYELFADAAVAAPALTGNVLQLTPTTDGYLGEWFVGTAAATYITPAGTPIGTISDDGQDTYTPATGFPSPYGPVTDLRVHGNGIVAFGTTPIDYPGTNSYTPTGGGIVGGTTGGVYAWHDYNVSESGSIIGEEQAGLVLVTYLDVDSYPSGVTNVSTLQFQFDQATGVIRVVFVNIDSDPSSIFGSGHLVGYSAPGAGIVDPGSIDLASQLPLAVGPELAPLDLTASGAPISTGSAGSTITYTLSNIPDANGSSGVFIGALALSVDGAPAGIDLGIIGAPGCNSYMQTIGIVKSDAGQYGSDQQTYTFDVPAGVPAGIELYANGAALIMPGSLPNGQNPGGLVTSNGVVSYIAPF